MIDFSVGDAITVGLYIILVLLIGFVLARRREGDRGAEDFLLAGRRITLPMFVATLVATWYGQILSIGEFYYTSGIVTWLCFALPYYIVALVFALLISGRIRQSGALTIPEQIGKAFGPRASIISAIIILVITIPASYILMLGTVVKIFTGWQLWVSIVSGALASLIYLYKGGFRADVYTNIFQFVLMYIGFAALVWFSVSTFGPPREMLARLPILHTTASGGQSWQYILVWFIIALQTFVDPSFHQRCAAARTPGTARRGIIISIGFWIVFDMLTLAAGLYSRAFIETDTPLMSFLLLSDAVMPSIWKGLFIVSILATIMSTLDSYAFISAATIGNDILKPVLKKFRTHVPDTTALVRAGLVLSSLIAVLMAIAIPSAIELIYKTSSIAVPGLLLPLLLSFSERYRIERQSLVAVMLCSSGGTALWMLISAINLGPVSNLLSGIEPMIPGIIISVLLTVIFTKKEEKHNVV